MQQRSSKKTSCTTDPETTARLLLDPARLAIIAALAEDCKLFTELEQLTGFTKGRLYFHIRILEEHCLINRSYTLSPNDKPRLRICINPDTRPTLAQAINNIAKTLTELKEKIYEKNDTA